MDGLFRGKNTYRTEFFHGIRLPSCLISPIISLQAKQDAINSKYHLHEMSLNSFLLITSSKRTTEQAVLCNIEHPLSDRQLTRVKDGFRHKAELRNSPKQIFRSGSARNHLP